jgi:hypothetical protein
MYTIIAIWKIGRLDGGDVKKIKKEAAFIRKLEKRFQCRFRR